MKNNLRMILMFGVCALVLGCASTSFAQTVEPIVGGYGTADVKDKEVISAANFAVKAIAKKQKATVKLISINKSESQVVAGMNYRLCLSVDVTKKGKKERVTDTFQTVVYKNLKQKFSLTSWSAAPCGESFVMQIQ